MSPMRRPPHRTRRRGLLAALMLTLAGTLAGAGMAAPVAAADSPEAAVDELLDLVAAGDLDGIDGLVCETQREAVRRLFDVGSQLGLPATDASLPPLTFVVTDRSVEVLEDTGDLALLRLMTTLSVELEDDQLRDLVRAMLEADQEPGDAPVSDADLEVIVPLMSGALSGGQTIDAQVVLIREADGWHICGGLGGRAEAPDDLPAEVSFDGLCGLVTVDQVSSLSELEYDSSVGAQTFCTYSLSSYEDYHTATVSLNQGYQLEGFKAVLGEGEETSVAGHPAFHSGEQLFVQVGEDVLQVTLDLGADPPPGLDVLSHAGQIAELIIPQLPQLELDEPAPEAPG